MNTERKIDIAMLKDGSYVTVRPIAPGDMQLERDFIMKMSPESRRFRFLDSIAVPSSSLLKKLTQLNEATDAALIALAVEQGFEVEVGVARISATNDQCAEFAVAVTDSWQRKGLGTLLTERIIQIARQRAIRSLYSSDASDNQAMRHFSASLGFQPSIDPQDATQVIYTLHLDRGMVEVGPQKRKAAFDQPGL